MSLKDAVPQSLEEQDPELTQLIEVMDQEISNFNPGQTIANIFDPARMPTDKVDKWLHALGWRQNWQVDKRRLLKVLLLLYRLGSTDQGIVRAVREFVGIDVAKISEAWPEAYAKGQAISDDEKCVMTVYLSNNPYGEQTLNLLPLAEQVCKLFRPGHAQVSVQVWRNKVQDVHFTIGSLSGQSIRAVTYAPLS